MGRALCLGSVTNDVQEAGNPQDDKESRGPERSRSEELSCRVIEGVDQIGTDSEQRCHAEREIESAFGITLQGNSLLTRLRRSGCQLMTSFSKTQEERQKSGADKKIPRHLNARGKAAPEHPQNEPG